MADHDDNHVDDASLHELFVSLIAQNANVSKEEVTEDWIMEQREKNIYPDARWATDSNYGGYSCRGMKVLTKREVSDIHSVTESLLVTRRDRTS